MVCIALSSLVKIGLQLILYPWDILLSSALHVVDVVVCFGNRCPRAPPTLREPRGGLRGLRLERLLNTQSQASLWEELG